MKESKGVGVRAGIQWNPSEVICTDFHYVGTLWNWKLSLSFSVFPELHEKRLVCLQIELDTPADFSAAIHK